MKMADILHSIADMLDKHEGGDISGDNMGKEASDFQHDVHDGADDAGAGDVEVGKFIPPLQAKHEIIKKSVGLDNEFDDDSSNELDDIKKLTGIKAVIQHDDDIIG
jgi:hypothetical protein